MQIKSTFNNPQVDYLQMWFLPSYVDIVIHFAYLSPLKALLLLLFTLILYMQWLIPNICLAFYGFLNIFTCIILFDVASN